MRRFKLRPAMGRNLLDMVMAKRRAKARLPVQSNLRACEDCDRLNAVHSALAGVRDPQSGRRLTELGLIGEVALEADNVWITLNCANHNSPVTTMQKVAVEKAVIALPGIRHAEVMLTCDPDWRKPAMQGCG